METPTTRHYLGLVRIMQYLKRFPDRGITFTKIYGNKRFFVFCDTDFAGDPQTRKSTTGFVIKYANGPITCVSRRQRNVTVSVCESEYCALTECAIETLWLSKLANIFNEHFPVPVIIYNDNQTAQNMVQNKAKITKMKHIDALKKHIGIKYMFIKELYNLGVVDLVHVASADNEADLFTKPNGSIIHNKLSRRLMNLDNYVHLCMNK